MPHEVFPNVDEEIVRELERMFPDRCPDLTTPEREVWAAAGRADVVRFLRAKREEQQETYLQDD